MLASKHREDNTGLLQNHIAAVTDSGFGIGRAIALGFAREGATVAARSTSSATAAKPPLTSAARRTRPHRLPRHRGKVASEVRQLSILINNAGIIRRNAFGGDPDAVLKDWPDIMAINLNGLFDVRRVLAPLRAVNGRIINLASIQSFHAPAHAEPAYTPQSTALSASPARSPPNWARTAYAPSVMTIAPSLGDPWADTTSPHGRLMLTVLSGVAKFERGLKLQRTAEGGIGCREF